MVEPEPGTVCCSCERPLPPNSVMLTDGRWRCVACQLKADRKEPERMVQDRRHPYGMTR